MNYHAKVKTFLHIYGFSPMMCYIIYSYSGIGVVPLFGILSKRSTVYSLSGFNFFSTKSTLQFMLRKEIIKKSRFNCSISFQILFPLIEYKYYQSILLMNSAVFFLPSFFVRVCK